MTVAKRLDELFDQLLASGAESAQVHWEGVPLPEARGMDREHIVGEIRRLAEDNGGVPLGRQRFEQETGIRESVWIGRYWTRWNDAITEPATKSTSFRARSRMRPS